MIVPYEEDFLPLIAEHLDEQNQEKFRNAHFIKFLSVEENDVPGWTILEISADRLLIDWIFVKEDARRSGIGSELMVKIKDFAKEKGVRGISVNTGSNTARARKFYEKHGFTEVGRVKEYFNFDPEHVFYWLPL